ncbi:MAG TPA: hypothetical protein VIU64_19170 [Polyangia bacterium]
MRICFVVADVRAQQPHYAGIYLALASHRRGHEVRFVSVDDLSFLDDNTVLATTRRVRHGDYASTTAYTRALSSDEAVIEEDNLGNFEVVFLRYNPTRENVGRVGTPLIDFAWRLRLGGTLVVNDHEGLRRAASRLYLNEFPPDIRAKTLVSRSPAQLKQWVRARGGPAVLKPLQPRGGEHVFFVPRRKPSNLNQIITTVTEKGYAVAQEYLPEIEQGEKRLLLLGAEPIRMGKRVAIYRRQTVIGGEGVNGAPGGGAGGRFRCDFGRAEQRICDMIRPKLLADGLYLVGVDIVGDKVLELNVFTPGGFHSVHDLYGIDVGDIVVRDLERRTRVRAAYRTTFDPEAADVV